MKKLSLYTIGFVALLFGFNTSSQAQAFRSCVDASNATVLNGGSFYSTLNVWNNTRDPQVTPGFSSNGFANLDASYRLEYIITKKGVAALNDLGNPDTTGGGGDVIVGTDPDGMFRIEQVTRYGITIANPNDSFQILPVVYKLEQIQNLADAILNGSIDASTTCCQIFGPPLIPEAAGFCDSVTNANIQNGSDIQSLNDVLTIFDAFSTAQLSVEGLASILGQINGYASVIPTTCGKNELPLCYDMTIDQRYTYYVASSLGTVSAGKIQNLNNFNVYPNPSLSGQAINLEVETMNTMELNAQVFNVLGELVYAENLGTVNGKVNAQLPALESGVYVVELSNGNDKEVRRLIVR
ncbi:MAG: T9SS type A sorting domain-containing protein [Saprospiraceae bacterium]|nr:T9SS type A sorting domain-containing protein [Saprospiraceae bacterium]